MSNIYKYIFPLQTCSEKLSVLSVIDNQIVTLTPRNHLYSGCSLLTQNSKDNKEVLKKSSPDPSVGRTPSNEEDTFTYDQFLKPSTPEVSVDPSEEFEWNSTEIDLSTIENSTFVPMAEAHSVEYNGLENSTDYRVYVEQLFDNTAEGLDNVTRIRRAAKFDTKLIVSCSNHGTFTSSRQRYD